MLNILNKEEIISLLNGISLLTSERVSFLRFDDYLEEKGLSRKMLLSDSERLESETAEYIKLIVNVNKDTPVAILPSCNHSETGDNGFSHLNTSNFDSNLNYVTNSGVKPLKEVIIPIVESMLLSKKAYSQLNSLNFEKLIKDIS